MAFHKNLTGDDIHVVYSFEYADQSARESATGLVAEDVGKFARQLDDDSLWMLTDHSPVTWIGVGSVSVDWGDIGGTLSDQTDLQNALDGKALSAHTHVEVDVTDLDKYTQSEINSLLSGKEDAFSKNTAFNKNFGTGSGEVCQGNDARLSDARTPTAHNTTHQSGGGDSIKLDDLAQPDDNTDLDATTGRHGLLPKLGGGTSNFLRADGSWAAPGSPVFGTQFNQNSSDGGSSTNSGTYQQKVRLSVASLPAGTYLVNFMAEARNVSAGEAINVRCQEDNTTDLAECRIYSGDAGGTNWLDDFMHFSGFAVRTLGAGSHFWDIDYNVTGSSGEIRRARIAIWRIA